MSVGLILAGRNWVIAFADVLPMLPIFLAGFCVNDIFDQEIDRINHPDRALAHYPALTKAVTALYVILFLTSMTVIILQKQPTTKFTWAITFIFLSNYNLFKQNFPLLKNAYIALTACVFISVFDLTSNYGLVNLARYAPFFMSVFARELELDIPDAKGDQSTLAARLDPTQGFWLSIAIYIIALSSALFLSRTNIQLFASIAGAFILTAYLFVVSILKWKKEPLRFLSAGIAVAPIFLVIT